jgi:methylglutaconyl-CoA hydratase
MSSYRKLLYSVDGAIARVTLNRPERRNALDAELIAELKDALDVSAKTSGVRVIVLAGSGPDFCSGADLSGLRNSFEAGPLENMAEARQLAGLFVQMRRLSCPVIAAVRGRALAGGCGLASAADVILASESAQFGYPEVNIGFVPAMVMAIIRRSIPEKRAFELVTLGESITAQTAFEIGMVTRLLADETFDMEVEAYAAKLAGKSASAVSMSKQLLYHMDAMSFEAAIEAGVQVNALARSTNDYRRGIERFLKPLS